MCSPRHSCGSRFISASPSFLLGLSELLWSTTSSLSPQHHRVSCCVRVHVREFPALSTTLGSLQTHFHHSFPVSKKAKSSDSKTHVIQMCGGLGIQKRNRSAFPAVTLPESIRGWQSSWFYCQDVAAPGQLTGLPPFLFDRVQTPAPLKVTAAETTEMRMLVDQVVQLINDGVTGLDLLEVFLSRRIQPL